MEDIIEMLLTNQKDFLNNVFNTVLTESVFHLIIIMIFLFYIFFTESRLIISYIVNNFKIRLIRTSVVIYKIYMVIDLYFIMLEIEYSSGSIDAFHL